jgi:UDP-glucose 4-epimerase
MAGKTVLVTGAYGFIGRYAAKAFAAAGWEVFGVGHGAWSSAEWREWGLSKWRASDVTIDALQTHGGSPDLIVHCAGGASVSFSMENPRIDWMRTVDTTLAVLEFARGRVERPRVVLVSSGSVYGAVEGRAREDLPPNPQSPYATHKQVAEELCREYGRFYDVRTAAVRLFSVYGPGLQKQLLWDACRKFARREASFSGTGSEVRDWLHVGDAASLLVAAAEHVTVECQIVNGGTGEGVSVAQVLEELSFASPCGAPPQFTGAGRPGDPRSFVADCDLARSWGWRSTVHWRDGIREYAKWYSSLAGGGPDWLGGGC